MAVPNDLDSTVVLSHNHFQRLKLVKTAEFLPVVCSFCFVFIHLLLFNLGKIHVKSSDIQVGDLIIVDKVKLFAQMY